MRAIDERSSFGIFVYRSGGGCRPGRRLLLLRPVLRPLDALRRRPRPPAAPAPALVAVAVVLLVVESGASLEA